MSIPIWYHSKKILTNGCRVPILWTLFVILRIGILSGSQNALQTALKTADLKRFIYKKSTVCVHSIYISIVVVGIK